MLRKSQPNFKKDFKKIEAQAKNRFPIKKKKPTLNSLFEAKAMKR